ncbi:MAG: hypothetical protein U0175_05195 [Caldilineaceae bacterium]
MYIRHLAFKPDFEQTIERFEAWWLGEMIDRPPITLSVIPSRPSYAPRSSHQSHRQRWLDIEFVIESAIATMERTDYVADSYPIFWSNIGPEITSTLFGCDLTFTENTSWSAPVIHQADDWQRLLQFAPNFENPYWLAMEQMTDLAIERCEGRYVVGLTDLHGNYDILAGLRDPMQLNLDLMDCPELVIQAGRHVAKGYVTAFERLYNKVKNAGFGTTTWCPVYHEGPAYVPSSDFWCMVSPRMAREWIWPDILVEMEPLERSIFHLDGVQALHHLDLLLDLPKLNAVQWVYGAGHGPALRWVDVYRRIRAAGKSLQLIAQDPADALAVLEQIGTKGVYISVEQPFASVEEAETFVKQVGKS